MPVAVTKLKIRPTLLICDWHFTQFLTFFLSLTHRSSLFFFHKKAFICCFNVLAVSSSHSPSSRAIHLSQCGLQQRPASCPGKVSKCSAFRFLQILPLNLRRIFWPRTRKCFLIMIWWCSTAPRYSSRTLNESWQCLTKNVILTFRLGKKGRSYLMPPH